MKRKKSGDNCHKDLVRSTNPQREEQNHPLGEVSPYNRTEGNLLRGGTLCCNIQLRKMKLWKLLMSF